MRYLIVVLLMCVTFSTRAECLSLEQAAVSGLTLAMSISREHEYGGAIYQINDCHFASEPQTSGTAGKISIAVRLPKGAQLVAIYHTHPGAASNASRYSPDDIEVHMALKLPSFIGVIETGEIRVLDTRIMSDRHAIKEWRVRKYTPIMGRTVQLEF